MVTFVLIRIQNGGVLDFGSPLHPDFFPELLCFLFKSGVATELFFKLWFLAVNPINRVLCNV